jgi:hypothetical protein
MATFRAGSVTVSERDLIRGGTVTFTVHTRKSVRVRIGILLLRLGCVLMGLGAQEQAE